MSINPQGVPPARNDPLLPQFLARFWINAQPVSLEYSDRGYDAANCHVSAKHCAMENKGRRVHGWAIWQFGGFIIAEHHSVWETEEGELVDVTPPKFGSSKILFLRDDAADIIQMGEIYALWSDRTNDPDHPFYFQNNPIEESTWGLRPTEKVLVEYSARLGLKPSDILTDPAYG